MPKLKLTYFDIQGGRGEVARLAMSIGNIEFEDHRISVSDWPTVKTSTLLHALPLLEVDDEVISQSNAINRYVGRLAGLYPYDPLEALRCDEAMDAVEDVVTQVVATFGTTDADAMRAAREALVDGPITLYLTRLNEKLLAHGGNFIADNRLTVGDLKIFVWIRSLRAGILDYVPADLPDRAAPHLVELSVRLSKHPAVVAYYGGE